MEQTVMGQTRDMLCGVDADSLCGVDVGSSCPDWGRISVLLTFAALSIISIKYI